LLSVSTADVTTLGCLLLLVPSSFSDKITMALLLFCWSAKNINNVIRLAALQLSLSFFVTVPFGPGLQKYIKLILLFKNIEIYSAHMQVSLDHVFITLSW
jgi:hypothetical protein